MYPKLIVSETWTALKNKLLLYLFNIHYLSDVSFEKIMTLNTKINSAALFSSKKFFLSILDQEKL